MYSMASNYKKIWKRCKKPQISLVLTLEAFQGGNSAKELAYQCRRCKIPDLGRLPEEGNGNPLQYCSLGNSMDRGAWWATVCGVAKIRTSYTHAHQLILSAVATFSKGKIFYHPNIRQIV